MNRKNFPWQKLSNKMRKHFSGRVLANVQAALLSETQTVVPDVRSRSNVRQDVRAAYTTTVVCALPPVGPSTGTGDASVGLRTSGVSHLCVLINQITLVEQKKKKRNTNFSSSSGPKTSSLESIDKYHIELVSYLTNGESHPFDLSACTDLKEDEETNHLKSYLKSYNVTASYNTCNTVLREYNNDVKLAASALLNAPFVDIGAALLPLVPDNEFKKANGGLDCASAPALLNAPFEEHGAAVQVVAKDEGKKVSGGNNRGGKENGDAVPLVGEKKLAKKSGGGVAWVSVSASLKQQLEELKSGVDEDDMNNMNTTTSTPTHNPSSNCTTNYDSHSTTSYRLSNAPLKENSDAVPLVGGKKLAKKSVVAWVSVSASQQPEELKIHEDNMITTTSTPTNNPSHYNSSNSTTNDDSHSMTSHRLVFDSYAWIDSTGSGQEGRKGRRSRKSRKGRQYVFVQQTHLPLF